MSLQPHQQRVVQEKAELDEKLTKLVAFSANPIFSDLPLDDRNLLVEQAHHMQAYSNVLGQRIARFPEAT